MELLDKTRENRKYDRLSVDFEVYSRDTGKLVGNAINLSLDGLLAEAKNPLKPGTKLLLEFKLPGNALPIKVYSDVRWIENASTSAHKTSRIMGVQFINIFEADRRKLEEYIQAQLKKINSDSLSLADFTDIPDKDLFAKTSQFWEAMKDVADKGFDTYGMPLLSAAKNRALIFDQTVGREREVVMMGTSNYLGLSQHPKVVDAVKKAIGKYGVGTGSVSLLSGTYDLHRRLESSLAAFKDCEDAAIFPTGHMANMGCIAALLGKKDVAIIDKMVHVSILDGCILSRGTFRSFRHSDTAHLRQVLQSVEDKYLGKLIIVEGAYGLDGDIAPLPEILQVAREFGAKVMVDEAHATGVLGERGRGTASHFGVEGKIDLVMDSLSKALGGLGGYIASSKEVIKYLRYFAVSSMFSVNVPPALVASSLAAIGVMESDPALINKLWENIKYMRENLKLMGFNNVEKSGSAIISTIVGNELLMRKMNRSIFEDGVYLEAIPYPAVPRGQERLRMRIMATHTKNDLDKVLEAMEKAGKQHGLLKKAFGSIKPDDQERQVHRSFLGKREITVTEVISKQAIEESLRFSWKVYEGCSEWVPYFLIEERARLLSGEYLYFKNNINSKRFVVKEDGEIVGAVSAFIDRGFIRYWNEKVGFLGFFEALSGHDAAIQNLLGAAFDFLKSQEIEQVIAPVNSPLVFYGAGLLSGGFGKTPSFLQSYTHQYYHSYFQDAGFLQTKSLPHYSIDLSSKDNLNLISSVAEKGDIEVRELLKAEYKEEALEVLRIYNEAFPRLWKYNTFTDGEFIEFVRDMSDLMLQGLWLIAEVGGDTVGFVGAFPQCAPLFKKIGGQLGASEVFTLPDEIERIKEGAVVLIGVSDRYRDRGIGAQLLAHICRNMIDRGYSSTTVTWEISDGSEDAGSIIKSLGGREDELEWSVYTKSLI